MKKLVILFTIAVIVCFTASLLKAQSDTITLNQMQVNGVKCTLFFENVLDGTDKNLEHFEDKVKYVLKTGFLREHCLLNPLKEGKDISVTYIGYTNGIPTKTELKYLIKSAVNFKEEVEDYIEDKLPHNPSLQDGDKYIVLQTEASLNLTKAMQKILKKENKKFDITGPGSKLFINISTRENKTNPGGIFIELKN